ncbi:hypothetical protein ColLi_13402 [Colletotrichum liriopes]|uniref:Uncharacterized protein n=1 Tax=Colletotrichum liriopes TaxID=708192 RepID=A0AA37LZP4_9PEZI|nr:hypothetical protein ColLi_13402 [Colletotrichum liriopes]
MFPEYIELGPESFQLRLPNADTLRNPATAASTLDIQAHVSHADFIQCEFQGCFIDQLAPHLSFFARKLASHIDPLHEQVFLKRRTISISENADLHLVWHDDTIYIKPFPDYLLLPNVWIEGLSQPPSVQHTTFRSLSSLSRSVIGFARSYSWLIRHPSDFNLAQREQLISDNVDKLKFLALMKAFRDVPDSAVTERYHYGQLRLSRLNLATRLVRPVSAGVVKRWYFQETRFTAGQYVRDYLAALLVFFAIFSIALTLSLLVVK